MELLTTVEAAERIELSARSLRVLVATGKIAVLRLGPGSGKLRFRPVDLETYEESCLKFVSRSRPRPATKRRPSSK